MYVIHFFLYEPETKYSTHLFILHSDIKILSRTTAQVQQAQTIANHNDDRGARLDSEEAFKTMLGKYGTKLEFVALLDGEKFGQFD